MNNVNSAVGPSSIVDKEHVLYGKAYITEQLRGLVFEISANSFFQTNTNQVPFNHVHCTGSICFITWVFV